MSRIQKKRRGMMRIALRVFVVGGFVTLLVLFLLAQRKPAWYTPVRINSDDLPGLRRDVTRNLDDISRKIVARKPFVLSWSEKELTRRLAAFRDIWPESRSAWPRELSDPVVKIETGSIRIGAFFERSGWRAIVGLRFAVDVPTDSSQTPLANGERNRSAIRVRLIEATAGSLGAPRWLLRRWIGPYLGRAGDWGFVFVGDSGSRFELPADSGSGLDSFTDPAPPFDARAHRTSGNALTVDQLFEGLLFGNDFIWPNGRRRFRITNITTRPGIITLSIEPE